MNEKPSLLLIDDEPDVLEAYKMMLEDGGYRVYTASNQKEALAILEEYPVGVCLIDLKMGEENGLQVSEVLTKADSLVKIIIITAYPTYDTAVDAIKKGVFDYVSKTADPRELLEKIENALELRKNEINAKAGATHGNSKNVVLVCNHVLNQGGIEKFCNEHPPYRLMHSYRSTRYIKPGDFNHQAELLLLCMDCIEENEINDPQETFPKLATLFPNARILVLNSKANLEEAQKINLVKYGVRGFLPGNTSKENMKKAFDAVLKNQLWISRGLTHKLLNELLEHQSPGAYKKPSISYNLSKREVETLQAMASGLSNHEISEKFFISENTVKIHINHIFKKLNVKSRTQAVMKGQEARII